MLHSLYVTLIVLLNSPIKGLNKACIAPRVGPPMGNYPLKHSVIKTDPLGTLISLNHVAMLHFLYVALLVLLNGPIKGLNMAYI